MIYDIQNNWLLGAFYFYFTFWRGACDLIYLPAKFLLKLSHKPDMNLSEGFSQSVRHVDDNSLPVPQNISLTAAILTKELSTHKLRKDNMALSKHDLVDNSC